MLPTWTLPILPTPMNKTVVEFYLSITATLEMRKFSGGYLLQSILTEMLNTTQNKAPADRRVYLYAGHEFNIAISQILLGVYNKEAPPFASFMIYELHEINGVYGVKILYQDYEGIEPRVLQLPGCDDICSFDKIFNDTQKYFPDASMSCN